MNPNNKTWQDRAREYLKAKNNPLSDQKSTEKLREGLELINVNGLSKEDSKLLSEVFNK